MVKYSTVKKKLKFDVEKTTENGLAHLTHYFQNPVNGVSQHYIKPATEYLSQLSDVLQLVEEPQMQQLLPMKFDVPFPPPTEYNWIIGVVIFSVSKNIPVVSRV